MVTLWPSCWDNVGAVLVSRAPTRFEARRIEVLHSAKSKAWVTEVSAESISMSLSTEILKLSAFFKTGHVIVLH